MVFDDKEELQLVVNSKFKLLYFLLCPTFKKFAYAFVGVLLWAALYNYIARDFRYLSIVIPIVIYISWFIINLFNTKREISKIENFFYKTKCYTSSGFYAPFKETQYSDIKICKLKRTFLDRIFGIGKIILTTNLRVHSWDTIEIPCVEHPEEVFNQITKLLDFEEKEDNVVKMEFKSKFILGHQIIGAILFAFVVTCVIYGMEGTAPMEYYLKTFIILLLVSFIKVFIQSKRYKKVKYELLNTKIKYKGTFNDVEVKYKNIKKIIIKHGFLGKKYGLGKIYLYTDSLQRIYTRYTGGAWLELSIALTIPNVTDVEEKKKQIELMMD